MKYKKCINTIGLALLSMMVMVGCIEDTQDILEDSDVPIKIYIKAETDNLLSSGSTYYTYTRVSEEAGLKSKVSKNIKTNFPYADISKMDLENGSISFTKEKVYFDPMVNTPKLPGNEIADSLSRKQLSQLGILPESEDEIVVEHIGSVNTTTYNKKTGRITTNKNLVTVYYGRKIDGLPVKGNSRMVTYLGKNGDLVGVIKKWTKIQSGTKIASSEIKSIKSVVSDMKNLVQNRFTSDIDRINVVNVNKVQIVMYDDGNVIEPALYSELEIANANGNTDKDHWITPILNTPKAKYSIYDKPHVSGSRPSPK
jgi:hypothetical protein